MRKNGRKWLSMLLAASLAIAFTACGQSGAPAAEKTETEVVESTETGVSTETPEANEIVEDASAAATEGAAAAEASTAREISAAAEASTEADGASAFATEAAEQAVESIDYMVLVNKNNALPVGWEDVLETVHMTNSVGDDVEVEKKAYDAYLRLKEDLEKEGIYVDLDSARRSVAEQERIMREFTEKYGENYAFKTVARPGYSEHHTGLALDLYLIVDGVDVVLNEDMVQYPEIWEKIHQKLPEYGFILRYLQGKEHITGYGYEPWHIRYLDNVDIAKEITESGVALETYLGAAADPDVEIDYGTSQIYTQEELEEAVIRIKCEFASWEGCELHKLSYAGDEANNAENLEWLNDHEGGGSYTRAAEFLSDFHSPVQAAGAWEPDEEYKDYQWWLARTDGGDWEIVDYGY